ncbi:hypothetical protein Gotur_016018 [Gossypium turneri]
MRFCQRYSCTKLFFSFIKRFSSYNKSCITKHHKQ